jgi:hypothetical protein
MTVVNHGKMLSRMEKEVKLEKLQLDMIHVAGRSLIQVFGMLQTQKDTESSRIGIVKFSIYIFLV